MLRKADAIKYAETFILDVTDSLDHTVWFIQVLEVAIGGSLRNICVTHPLECGFPVMKEWNLRFASSVLFLQVFELQILNFIAVQLYYRNQLLIMLLLICFVVLCLMHSSMGAEYTTVETEGNTTLITLTIPSQHFDAVSTIDKSKH